MPDPKIERILIANDARGVPVVLATDGALTAMLCREFSTGTEDIGIDGPDRPGLFLFEGYGKYEAHSYEYPNERDLVWYGALRPVRPDEIEELFKMCPPEEEDRS